MRSHLILALLLTTASCVHRAVPPPAPTDLALAGGRATYRLYGTGGNRICDAEPRWLADELQSMNALLGRYLKSTSRSLNEEWTRAEQETLTEGEKVIPDALKVHTANITAVKKCGFAKEAVFHDVLVSAAEIIPEVKARLAIAPELSAYLTAKAELRQWRTRVVLEKAESYTYCKPRSHEVYFAYEDENGITRIYFCDDGEVTWSPETTTPDVSVPSRYTSRALRQRYERLYLDKAKSYPKSEIREPPVVPPPPNMASASR